ncbi:hypothetical protein VV99796_04097 [Vibrio vulnificus]|nr:hypothetical protein VV99796_04097 [Vibrio vulnificus]OJI41782.1 hypothetical protein VVS316_04221 [Vibrio vulnificus]
MEQDVQLTMWFTHKEGKDKKMNRSQTQRCLRAKVKPKLGRYIKRTTEGCTERYMA